ncbi:HypC/HybG/HupF family hydrogenase formation chaperone [Pyrofollis japonicus]|uniref:HypC/HybG/HupF family hydrogenase formation chaperone n=1 Tax=Pyrofollis japonicus TaxID=3060460 RepID=UPI00295B6D89|nr:HypC/HybG/HupF family hydrogenase formation chaperone [Pyrofollis japonicus]BEP18449.1 HypC/HybG/HupF family hydrogenase formation chaperone [Pyrofollis japonicus]
MCLGIPAEVKEVKGDIVLVDFGDGVLREVYGGTYEDLRPGDLVVVHAGVIIEKLKPERAEELVNAINEFIEDLESKAQQLFEYLEKGEES